MNPYTGDERRDQSLRGGMLRKWIEQARALEPPGARDRLSFGGACRVAREAWRMAYELGRLAGQKSVIEHIEGELGAMKEGE